MSELPETVHYTTTRYRRWWQLWKPKSWKETNRYRVVRGFSVGGDTNANRFEGCSAYNNRAWATAWDTEGNPILAITDDAAD